MWPKNLTNNHHDFEDAGYTPKQSSLKYRGTSLVRLYQQHQPSVLYEADCILPASCITYMEMVGPPPLNVKRNLMLRRI